MSGETSQAANDENIEHVEIQSDETVQAEETVASDAASGDRVAELEAELAEMKNRWMRAVADAENLRRRGERDKQDALKYGVTNFAREMVGVADNLRRALESASEELKGSDLVTGVEMTERELQNAFNKAGIKRVEAQGKPFDHNFHQAVFEIPDPSQPAGLVGQVMQDGYVIHDRLLRPAMVGVTKGGPKLEVAPATDETGEASDSDAYEKPQDQNAGQAGSTLDQET